MWIMTSLLSGGFLSPVFPCKMLPNIDGGILFDSILSILGFLLLVVLLVSRKQGRKLRSESMKKLFLKTTFEFWLSSGIVLCCVATVSPTQAQTKAQILSPENIRSAQIPSPEELRSVRPLVNSAIRIRNIPAWSSISSRWMFVDIKRLIEPTCSVDRGQETSKFIITGRGGLPPSPSEALRSDAVQVDLGTPIQSAENSASTAIFANPSRVSAPLLILEAQGWVISNKGEVVLTAQAPNVTPRHPWLTPANCHAPKNSS